VTVVREHTTTHVGASNWTPNGWGWRPTPLGGISQSSTSSTPTRLIKSL